MVGLIKFVHIHQIHIRCIQRSNEKRLIFVFNGPECYAAITISNSEEMTSRVDRNRGDFRAPMSKDVRMAIARPAGGSSRQNKFVSTQCISLRLQSTS
jgi:hypothetical protein